jgi:acetolactate synthase-1/2/3 large subunit
VYWATVQRLEAELTVFCILQIENMRQRIPAATGTASQALTSLAKPVIDWVALAGGMGVPGFRAETAEQLAEQVTAALKRAGPTLIQAVLL